MAKAEQTKPDLHLTYTNQKHIYYLNGKRAKGVTSLAKIPTESYALEKYDRRMVAIGLTLDPNLIQNIAVDLEDKDGIEDACAQAKTAARAHEKADRGSQMHRVLEYILLDQEDKLLTQQQHDDAVLLKKTLDRYKLTPHEGLVEQFVAWPCQIVCGRFDAVLERADGKLILVDLKSGPNAVLYPQSTSVQLALYARAPHVSLNAPRSGDKQTVTEWRTMPTQLDRRHAYVMLVQPGDDIGTLHEIDIEHGWAGASLALQVVQWRKEHDYGRSIASLVEPELFNIAPGRPPTWMTLIRDARHLDDLRLIWKRAHECGDLTEDLRTAVRERTQEMSA